MPTPTQPGWPLQSSTLTACGVRTRVLQGGADLHATEAVVFVHGNPGSSEDWRELMEDVSPHGRVIAFDMPGFGQAEKPASFPYSVEGGATFLGEALRQLGVLRAHLVLHDFGGPWGLMWAALNPMSLASLTLVNTGVMRGYRWHTMARIWRTPLLGELAQLTTTRSGFGWVLGKGAPRGLPPAFVDRMYRDMDWGTKRAVLRLYRATGQLEERSATLAAMLAPIQPPTLVVWGAADPYLPARLAEQQKETFHQAQVVMLPDSGHFPFADNPQAVAQAVVPFLQAQLVRSGGRSGHAASPSTAPA
ncbi:MAG: alpha/beta hydrolase [Proteobacteria bacterium]|uniref:alpha/beta fold hydrolase n=1 Tax=Aquabacterium sp. TaxID=1872578 RepID=UPI0035C6BEF3|nr:alpha/beta hydrolase [Pseudomonadota bacterium]